MRFRRSITTTTALVWLLLASPAVAQDSSIPLGTPMPGQNVRLLDAQGRATTLAALKGKEATVVLFWGNRCPWTDRYGERISVLAKQFTGNDKVVLLVNSNDAGSFPGESAEASASYAAEKGLAVAYLSDARSELARAFGATRTPQAFVFDAAGTLVYSGAIDDSPGDPDHVSKPYLRDALAAITDSQPIAVPETKAFGCMIRPVR